MRYNVLRDADSASAFLIINGCPDFSHQDLDVKNSRSRFKVEKLTANEYNPPGHAFMIRKASSRRVIHTRSSHELTRVRELTRERERERERDVAKSGRASSRSE